MIAAEHDIELSVTFKMKRFGVPDQNEAYVKTMQRQIELAFGNEAIMEVKVNEELPTPQAS